jgi:hypothetical protein
MSKFSHTYANCLREAKHLANYPLEKPLHLNDERSYGDQNNTSLITSKFKNAKAYLDELKPLIQMIDADFKRQEEMEEAGLSLMKKKKETCHVFRHEIHQDCAYHLLQLVTHAINGVEDSLTLQGTLEKPPLNGTPEHKAYLRLVLIMEALATLLIRPALFSQIRVCTCSLRGDRVRIHIGNMLYYDFGAGEPFLDTLIWDIRHTYIEAHFKNDDEPLVYRMEAGKDSGARPVRKELFIKLNGPRTPPEGATLLTPSDSEASSDDSRISTHG